MSASRPDPDLLLARVRESEVRARRGHLTIFFGANAGVGKTYAMLEAAQRRHAEGLDVVAGYVELHGRAETERLLAGLELLPALTVKVGDVMRRELALDAALIRRPRLLLVDELAHTNLSAGETPPRHTKRWQDVEELLDAGIDVYTTVNVQHLESLSDVVWQITGVRQQETLPDRVFDEADEIKLVDLPPDDLLQRLREGRIYHAKQAEQALDNFFRKGNLIALRELALRRTADRVDQAMRAYRREKSVRGAWATRDRLLVAVGPDSQAEGLVRAGKRFADRSDAEWLVVFVETPNLLRLSEGERNRRIAILRLATSLGAEAITLGGPSASTELLAYARTRDVSRILIGTPNRPRWRRLLRTSTTERLLALSHDIDVLIVARPRTPALVPRAADFAETSLPGRKPRWPRYLLAVLSTCAATAVCWAVYQVFPALGQANVVMIYLLNCALTAVYGGRRAAALSAVLGVALFDFLFVPPRFSFAVGDAQYAITFCVMLAVALLIGNLNASVRLQARVAGHRERRTSLLYAMTRQLASARSREDMAEIAVRHVAQVFSSRVVLLFPAEQSRLAYPRRPIAELSFTGADLGVAQWVLDHSKPAGMATDTLSGSAGLYLPLTGTERAIGVIALLPQNPRRVTLPEQYRLLETFAAQIGQALERAAFALAAQSAEVRAETEAIRNALLASISHDLRTPLATIAGGAATLADSLIVLSDDDRRALAISVSEEAARMSERVTTLLDLVRLESGAIRPRLDVYALDELVGSVLHRVEHRLQSRRIHIELPEDLPLLKIDGRLIEQVLENLLDNISKYTPPDSQVWIRALAQRRTVEISIEDDGPGLPVTDPEILFRKFQRGAPEGSVGGIGLGLAICRTITTLHGCRIWAESRAPHGAAFRFTLPAADA
jgi:two-component system, OmpR family, sensor histidine kinase KdpD